MTVTRNAVAQEALRRHVCSLVPGTTRLQTSQPLRAILFLRYDYVRGFALKWTKGTDAKHPVDIISSWSDNRLLAKGTSRPLRRLSHACTLCRIYCQCWKVGNSRG